MKSFNVDAEDIKVDAENAHEFGHCQTHQAHVSRSCETRGTQNVMELSATLNEPSECHNCIERVDDAE